MQNPEPASTSLVPVERNVGSPPAHFADAHQQVFRSDCDFRHTHWRRQREAVRNALLEIHGDRERLRRFDWCGSHAWVMYDRADRERLKIVADYCHDRFCRVCMQTRGRVIARNIVTHLQKRRHRFVTLTIKTDDLDLVESVAKLYRSFRRLRETVLWRDCVRGGGAFLEVKRSADNERWHPHLHLITEGKYLPKDELRSLWKRITGDSYIVDVSLSKSPDHTARYVAGYCQKSIDRNIYNDRDTLVEAMCSLTGRRMCHTFGTWRGLKLTDFNDDADWQPLAKLSDLRKAAAEGNVEALEILGDLLGRIQCFRSKKPDLIEQPRDGPSQSASDLATHHSVQAAEIPSNPPR